MKLLARAVVALAFFSLAAPAFPCGDAQHATTTAKTEKKADKKPATVAKSGRMQKKGAAPANAAGQAKPATAAN